jgi:DnaJ family protein C protein 17
MDAGKRMLAEAQKRAFATAKTAKEMDSTTGTGLDNNGSTTRTKSNTNGNANGTGHGVGQPPITPIDLTLILQFPPSHPLSDVSILQTRLEASYGPINHVFLKDPPAVVGEGSKKKKPKGRKAIVEFKEGNWGGCWACWRDLDRPQPSVSGSMGVGEGVSGAGVGGGGGDWEGVKVKWAAGEIPAWVSWSETHRPRPRSPHSHVPSTNSHEPNPGQLPTFTSAPNFGQATMSDLLASHTQSRKDEVDQRKRRDEFESMTLLKMRQMERERLAEEIRREEED